MLTVKLLAFEIGILLVYAGVKGLSVGALLRGDNTKTVANTELRTGITQTATATVGASGVQSGYAQGSGANLH